MKKQVISCVITTYKREPEILKRAVESIINQTYKDTEIIVVNDAPEENELSEKLEKMLTQFGEKVRYIVHDKNRGACEARNTGLKNAEGEYIAFLDDDDEWIDTKLELQYQLIVKEHSSLVYSPYYCIDKNGKSVIVEEKTDELPGDNDFEKLLCYNFVGSTSFPLLRTSSVRKVGGFNSNLRSSQDHELWLKIAREYKISYCNVPLINYYYSEDAITRSIANRIQGHEYLFREFENEYKRNKKVLNYRYNFLMITYMGAKKIKPSLKYWIKAFMVKPFSGYNLMPVKKALKKIRK